MSAIVILVTRAGVGVVVAGVGVQGRRSHSQEGPESKLKERKEATIKKCSRNFFATTYVHYNTSNLFLFLYIVPVTFSFLQTPYFFSLLLFHTILISFQYCDFKKLLANCN